VLFWKVELVISLPRYTKLVTPTHMIPQSFLANFPTQAGEGEGLLREGERAASRKVEQNEGGCTDPNGCHCPSTGIVERVEIGAARLLPQAQVGRG